MRRIIIQQYNYIISFGGTEYSVIVKTSETAKETINSKLTKLLIKDSLENSDSKGET
ncbi:MAG: hypothetical protein IJW43_03720 [Clostridia bacterium]|nr:hypothetical protein [Clostridia bacterium]